MQNYPIGKVLMSIFFFFQIRMAMTKGAVAIVLDITEYHAAVRLVSCLIGGSAFRQQDLSFKK